MRRCEGSVQQEKNTYVSSGRKDRKERPGYHISFSKFRLTVIVSLIHSYVLQQWVAKLKV